ncbi:aromatic amino acid ammonia-lyase [Kitasatospora misakiensis]|uniref:Aromatic amino acid ammonia-lyase n=1 Tax=Kitasatospora misakiensis TaxID=67330 RepID=A0ABW0X022_9ACTN
MLLDGHNLSPADVVGLAAGAARPEIDPAALDRMARSCRLAGELVATGRVYGRSTGVGANRTVDVAADDERAHGLRLLRSHAGAIGEPLPGREVRAMLAVRTNQLLAGGAGLRAAVVQALAEALGSGAYPVVHEYGSVGTGDLGALAQTGLALAGEGRWEGGTPPGRLDLDSNDALALISSNALTIGQACLALEELRGLMAAAQVVAALSLLAVDGSLEPYAEPVHVARPHPGAVSCAARMRRLLGAPARPPRPTGSRIQDPYGFRCLPQIHGPALEAADALERVLLVELNAAAENPLISVEDQAAYHHGNFFAADIGFALDHFRLALLSTARLSTARLAALAEPGLTGLRPFLAEGASASSGMMILEYAAGAAFGELRALAGPASLGHTVLSRGVEELASFASLAARQTLRCAERYRLVLGCELVAAVRALRQHGLTPDPGLPIGRAFALAAEVLDPDCADRPLTGDVAAAARVLDLFAEL